MIALMIGFGEVAVILLVLVLFSVAAAAIAVLIIWLTKRNKQAGVTAQLPSPLPRNCPQCDAPLAADAPQGLCAKCLVKVGLGSEPVAGAAVGDRGEDETRAAGPRSANAAATTSAATTGNAAPDLAEIAKRFPQLEILELLGAGGMGVVYKARQPQLDRLVALKILPAEAGRDPAFAERFTREARALAKLGHPNIVGVYDFGQAEGLYYFIMEFVDGANLRQMERAGKLTPAEALTIVPKICDALQYAHDEGIVHRDIKPENILVDKKGRVKIADFGLAKLLGKPPTDFTLTGTHQAMGTPHYMAPEQMEKPLSVDHRADIYSLGVVFYEMLTGELPIGRFQPPSAKVHVDVRLDEVVLRSMERDVERRYQHVSEVKTDVEEISHSGTGVPSVSPKTLGHDAQATDAIQRQVKGPVIGLVATAVLNWLGLFVVIPLVAYFAQRSGAMQEEVPPLLILILAAGTALILWGALKMRRLESLAKARMAAILAMIVGPGYLVGWPVGIWALVVLARPEVKAAFRLRGTGVSAVGVKTLGQAESDETRSSANAQATPRRETNWVMIILVVVGCLLAIPVVVGLLWFAVFSVRVETLPTDSAPVMRSGAAESRMSKTLKLFTTADPTITKSVMVQGNDWIVDCKGPQTIQLFAIPNPGIENCTVKYRAALKAEGLQGRAYLEMWCRVPGRGESFSKGLDKAVSGDMPWDTYEIPFYLKEGERPDLIRLNLVVEGTGRVGIRNIEVRTNAKQVSAAPAPDQTAWTSLFDGKELGRWKVTEDPERPAASGKVRVQAGQIVLGEENVRATAGVGWTGAFPTMDYEVEWEGMVQKVKDTQRVMMFPVGKDLPFVAIRGEVIEGKFGPVNGRQLEVQGATNQPPLLDGRWYPFRIRVSQAEGIGVWVDGHKVVSHRVTGFRFGGAIPVGPSVPKSLGLGIEGPSAGGVRNIRMRLLPPSATAKPSDLSPSEARALIPEAASMSFADFQKLTGSGDANVAKFDNQSLSLVLLSLRMDDATKKNAAAMADFRYLEEAIHPAALVRAVSLSQNRGYATLIQPDFITDCTCSASEGAATGVVSFRAEGLYAGKVEFLARWNNGAWQIDEFRLPGYGIKTVRGDDGRWVNSALQSK